MAGHPITITVSLANGTDHHHGFTVDQYLAYEKELGDGAAKYLQESLISQQTFWIMEPVAFYNPAHVACVQIDSPGSAEIGARLREENKPAMGFQRPSTEA